MNYLDIAVLVIIILNIGLGWLKGLIRSVINVISIILGFMAARMYHADLYDILNQRFDLYEKLKTSIGQTFSSVELPSVDLSLVNEEMMNQHLVDNKYLQVISEKFINSDTFHELMPNDVTFADGLVSWLADNILSLLSMVIIFIGVYIGVRLIGLFLHEAFKLPVLKGVNKLSGLVFGLVKGLFFAMLFVLVAVIIGPIFDSLNIIETLESSKIAIYLYQFNIFIYLFEFMM